MKKAIGDNMIPREWGYDGIELWLGDVPWFQMATSDSDVRELRRKVENAGLVVSNVSTGLHWAAPLSAKLRDFSRVIALDLPTGQTIGWADGLPVALRRQAGRGTFIFLGSPLGPALWAGDVDAKRWLLDVVRS